MHQCTKCKVVKPVSDFYCHIQNFQGKLGACKECLRSYQRERQSRLKEDPEWIAKERERCRKKSEDVRKSGKASPVKYETRQAWRERNREKIAAQSALSRAVRMGKIKRMPCEVCGDEKVHGHHFDYSQPLSVWWLCPRHHGEAHRKDNPLIIVK